MLIASWGVLQVFWSMIWFFLFIMWLMLVFRVFADIFRSPDMSGIAKAGWVIFAVVLPFIGVLSYLIVRGPKMAQHEMSAAQAQQDAVKQYIQSAAGTSPSVADELSRLAELRDRGVIDDAEFGRLKAKLVG